jgi:hypothetical protein
MRIPVWVHKGTKGWVAKSNHPDKRAQACRMSGAPLRKAFGRATCHKPSPPIGATSYRGHFRC